MSSSLFRVYHREKRRRESKKKKGPSLLLGKVERDGKVLPRYLIDRRRPDLGVLPVEDLEGVLVAGTPDDRPRLEVELVGAVVACLVPDVLGTRSLISRLDFGYSSTHASP